jgi:hypothetical protein
MTILPFIARSAPASLWRVEEMSQLLSIYAAHEAQGEASDWDTGETESREPQFYVLGAQPEMECVVSITRRADAYLLEDGRGHVVAENRSLSAIADKAVRMTSGSRRAALLARIGVAWIAAREFFEEKLEPLMAEPIEVATHFFPQLAALA